MSLDLEYSHTVFRVWWDNMQDWDGETIYVENHTAMVWAAEDYKEWMREADRDYEPGEFSWLALGKQYWHLYEDNAAIGIVIKAESVYKAAK